jgi:hypothetical protein
MGIRGACVVTKLLLLAIAVEAAVELWKKAAPLQGVKRWIISKTPFLYSKEMQTHLLLCPYCCSLWLGGLMAIGYLYMDTVAVTCIVVGLVAHRLSNYLHIMYSILADMQRDLRVNRRT